MINNLKKIITKNFIYICLVFIFILSFKNTYNYREYHFQELDSYQVFQIMADPQEAGRDYLYWAYNNNHTSILDKFIDNFPHQKIEKLSPLAIFRLSIMDKIDGSNLPIMVKRALYLPLSSTYSLIPGVFASIAYSITNKYQDFIAVETAINLFILHLSAFILFLILINFKIDKYVSLFTTTLFLFSTSIYSYGFHLGSTIWNILSISIIIYFETIKLNSKFKPYYMSFLAGLLIFTSYLIIIPYFSYLLIIFSKNLNSRYNNINLMIKATFNIAKTQYFALLLFTTCFIFFYLPGQGLRGHVRNLHEIPAYLYFTFLNFFSWTDVQNIWISGLEFSISLILLLLGVILSYKFFLKKDGENKDSYAFILLILLVYLLMNIVLLLTISPSRQILFLAPLLYVYFGIGLNYICKNFRSNIKSKILIIMIFSFAQLGLHYQNIRFQKTYDFSAGLSLPGDVLGVVVLGSGQFIGWKINAKIFNWNNIKTLPPGKYLYVSQETPLKNALINSSEISNITVLSNISNITTNYNFIAATPNFGDERFNFNRPNNLYISYIEKK